MASLKQWMSATAESIASHVGTLLGSGVHGMSGWGADAKALAGTQNPGTATTVARGDHVHPTTGLLLTTDRGGTPVALGSAAAEGDATTVARSNHVHPYPTAANVGAMATSHAANAITGFGVPVGLGSSAAAGDAATVARSNHVHPYPTAANVGAMATSHAANAITGFGSSVTALGLSSAGNSGTVSRSDHTHPSSVAMDFSLTASSGTRKLVIGSGRNSFGAGSSTIEFYSANNGALTADIVADGGSSLPLRIRRRDGGGDIRLQAPTSYVRNAADTGWGNLYVGHIGYQTQANDSDPRIKRNITPASPRVSPRALADTTIRFNFRSEPATERQRLGFDAARLRDIAPDIVRSRSPAEGIETEAGLSEVLGFDPIGMLAVLAQQVADLADRVAALESRP